MNVQKILDYLRKKPLVADILCIVVLVVPTIIALLNNHYPSMHDDQHVARLFLFDKAFREGDMYPRWVDLLGFGYGYPLFNFYPPMIYFVSEVFRIIGFSFIWSIKMMIVTGFISAAIGMYLFAKSVFNRYSGILAAALYTYFTYHAITVYVRGAFAEFFTLSILPFVFLTLRNFALKRSVKNATLFGISFGALIITHPLIAFPSVLYIGAFGAFYYWQTKANDRKEFLRRGIFSGLLGLGLSAFFWLPSVIEKKFTMVDDILTRELANYKIHFVCLDQLWYSAWGYGGSGAGCTDGMTFQLGKVHIGFLALSGVIFLITLFTKSLPKKRITEILFFTGILALSVFMMLDYSSVIWDSISFLWYLQFPWRFMTFVAVFISLLGGGASYFMMQLPIRDTTKDRIGFVILCVGVFASILIYSKYFNPYEQRALTDAQMTSNEEIAWRISRTSFEFVPKGVRTKKSELNTTVLAINKEDLPTSPYKLIAGRGIVEPNELTSSMKTFIVKQDQPVTFRLNTYNFPGWEAYIVNAFENNTAKQLPISDENGLKLITVTVPPGEYILTFIFRDTVTRVVAGFITLASLAFVILFALRRNKYVSRLQKKVFNDKVVL
jgi:hypothetical protein